VLAKTSYFPPCGDALRRTTLVDESVRDRLLALNARRAPADAISLQVSSPDTFVARPDRLNAALTMTERESLGLVYAMPWMWC
jgi:hypothetical protein